MGYQGAMDIDLPTEIGPTEETVDALMEYLVDPLLPLKHTDMAKETPSESKQKSVAKQVHAAVVLYNYYHLNQHRGSQFLKFDQFCKLAIMLKPSILHHMKYMRQSDHTIINDPENQLSLTEKAIMDACTISETLLNASANISNVISEWKITKVAVLLIDSKKENCFLQFDNGVWSVIEKELYSQSKKRKKIMTEYDEECEVGFLKLAFSVVKEETGIMSGKLRILERHVAYSLSKAKTATRFYVLQSTQAISEEKLVPIQDVISSLHGPVVKKCLGSWAITPVVEYYYLLPYAEIITKLFSRESNNLPHQVKEGSADVNIIQTSRKSCEEGSDESKKVINNLQKKPKLDTYKSNQCNEKESGESKEVSDNLQQKSKPGSENVHIGNSGNEEPHDIKVGENTHQADQCSEKESGESKKVSDNLLKKSKFDSEIVHISNFSSNEEPHDSEVGENTLKFNKWSENESGVSKKVNENLQKKSKFDFEIVHISNSSKEEPHECNVSENTYKSNQCSEKESDESKEVFIDLKKKSKLDSEIVHISSSSKEEPHDGNVSENAYKLTQCSFNLEPVSKVADDVDQKVKETENSIGSSIIVFNSESMKQEDMDGSCIAELSNSSSVANNHFGTDEKFNFLQTENKNTKFQKPLKVFERRKRKANLKGPENISSVSQSKDEMVDGEKSSFKIPHNEDRSPAVNYILEDVNSTVDAKRSELLDAALRALLYKRQKLHDQQRVIDGELTLCDKKIQAIMHGGNGDCLGLQLDAVIECCNELCKQVDMQTLQHTDLQASRSLPILSGKSLSEAQLTLRKACQELEDICLSNSWMLPIYRTSRSDGGFVANVTVKGTNFECSGVSGDQPSIREARNSAATNMITRLQQMAGNLV